MGGGAGLLAGLISLRRKNETYTIRTPNRKAHLIRQLPSHLIPTLVPLRQMAGTAKEVGREGERPKKRERGTYTAGQINVKIKSEIDFTSGPVSNAPVQLCEVSRLIYNVGTNSKSPTMAVGTIEAAVPSLSCQLLRLSLTIN